uniref:Tetraspanin n=1 Tax=Megaselia scalaris TaxID=36166 RepID=T1GGK7_MEGSC
MLFMSEFLVGAVAFAFRNALTRTLSNEMRFAIENHYNASDRGSLASPSVASIWDNIQTNFECCGVTSYEDWYNIKAWSELWFDKGCVHSFQNWIVKHLHVVGTIGLVIASIQLIGLLCSMLLFCSVKRRSKRSPESYKSYSPSSADLHSKNVSSWED